MNKITSKFLVLILFSLRAIMLWQTDWLAERYCSVTANSLVSLFKRNPKNERRDPEIGKKTYIWNIVDINYLVKCLWRKIIFKNDFLWACLDSDIIVKLRKKQPSHEQFVLVPKWLYFQLGFCVSNFVHEIHGSHSIINIISIFLINKKKLRKLEYT